MGVVTAFSPESVGVDLTIVYIFCFWEVDAVAKERFKFHSCQSNKFVFGEANWLGMGSRGWVHYINNNVSENYIILFFVFTMFF